jgi:hypothetical protein
MGVRILKTGALYSAWCFSPSFVIASSNLAIEPCVRSGWCAGEVGRESKRLGLVIKAPDGSDCEYAGRCERESERLSFLGRVNTIASPITEIVGESFASFACATGSSTSTSSVPIWSSSTT